MKRSEASFKSTAALCISETQRKFGHSVGTWQPHETLSLAQPSPQSSRWWPIFSHEVAPQHFSSSVTSHFALPIRTILASATFRRIMTHPIFQAPIFFLAVLKVATVQKPARCQIASPVSSSSHTSMEWSSTQMFLPKLAGKWSRTTDNWCFAATRHCKSVHLDV